MDDRVSVAVLQAGILRGKCALVTGAGTGIGRGIAVRLASLGARVFGLGRRRELLEETKQIVAANGHLFDFESCDVRDATAVEALIQRVGDAFGIDILVNNAGGQFTSHAEKISRRGWNAVIDLNLNSVFTIIKASYPYLAKRGGRIINISLSQVDRGATGVAHSIAARAGVLGLSRTLALEWARDGITVNCIGPGTVLTEGFKGNYRDVVLRQLKDGVPMGRDTTVEEIAELTCFLATPAGAMMTGQLIQIDGGAHIGVGLGMLDATSES